MSRLAWIVVVSIWCIPALLFAFRHLQLRRRRERNSRDAELLTWKLDGRQGYPPLPLPLPCPPPSPAPMQKKAGSPCDICGSEFSTASESDLLEVKEGGHLKGPNDRRFVFSGRRRFGCAKHPPVALCYNLDGSIAVSAPIGFEHKDGLPNLLIPGGSRTSANGL